MQDPFVALMRRYVVDYTNRQDTGVCAEIMEPDYTLRMGPHEVSGRDEAYIPASRRQFTQFPGLGLTVHEVVSNGERLALRFSEHGASQRHGGGAAAWTGLGLYRWNGTRLQDNSVEQDYLSRRRQLASGAPATVGAPAVAPWDTPARAADPAAEAVVRAWIAAGLPAGGPAGIGSATVHADLTWDDGGPGSGRAVLADPASVVDDLFSAGDAVAFRLTCHGRYAGGLDDVTDAPSGTPATLHLVGLVHVRAGQVTSGHLVRDRLGAARALSPAPARS
ncbi:nuclear transport factor 2 family protein [Pseudonocardia sp. KRD291]|uniref:nuclear transport factor 2 family protein n=1 Tax=Pseudonocardia sp. KRD291 TaxID=2792007 RepID=UPI001C4A6D2C|nr:nuclear transport factor 2 family protein [Pseudonocardia sp. KRD291]MBW0103766.1 nuclear transport factor 2 family protein [Pseudonocardia sp. KRD291]